MFAQIIVNDSCSDAKYPWKRSHPLRWSGRLIKHTWLCDVRLRILEEGMGCVCVAVSPGPRRYEEALRWCVRHATRASFDY